jgi:hypothetical protein
MDVIVADSLEMAIFDFRALKESVALSKIGNRRPNE